MFQGALPLDPALRRLKNLFEKRFLRISKNFWKNLLAEFLAVLFSPNGSRTHVGPLPHKYGSQYYIP
jgi:hypothetical protein